MRISSLLALSALLASVVLAQSAASSAQGEPSKLEFDVASIKPSGEFRRVPGMRMGCYGGPGTPDPELVTCAFATVNVLLFKAFGLEDYRISAPDWAAQQRFDVRATVPAGATEEQVQLMWQNLLIDRFKLTYHRENKEMQTYVLLVANGGPKLKPGSEEAEAALKKNEPQVVPGQGGRGMRIDTDKDGYPLPRRAGGWASTNGRARFYEPNGGVQSLLPVLGMLLDKPVADQTGLKDKYEINLYWVGSSTPPRIMEQLRATMAARAQAEGRTIDPQDPEVTPNGPSLTRALEEQLGLRLELKKGPVETVVVDHLEKNPTAN